MSWIPELQMYHPHLKTVHAELIAGALASMAFRLPEMEQDCRNAIGQFESLTIESKFENHLHTLKTAKNGISQTNKITWTCHICGEERPDRAISVYTRDVSDEFNLPAGTVGENVRYCNDRAACANRAPQHRHLKDNAHAGK